MITQIGLVDLEINRLTKILFISMIALAIAMLALKVMRICERCAEIY